MEKTFNFIIIIGLIYVAYLLYKKETTKTINPKNVNQEQIEEFNQDKIFNSNIPDQSIIKFNYETTNAEKQFIREQEVGMNLNSWYPNTWIEKINLDGKPIYNSRKNNEIVESKMLNSYLLDPQRNINIGGKLNPLNIEGQSIKEIYDNSIFDYRNTIQKKVMLDVEPGFNSNKAASNLSFYSNDIWVYSEEKPLNGGELYDGIQAVDPANLGAVAKF